MVKKQLSTNKKVKKNPKTNQKQQQQWNGTLQIEFR